MLCLVTMKKVDSKEPVNRGMLDEAVDAILKGMERMFAGQEKRFDKVDTRLDKLEVELSCLKGTELGL